MAHVPYSKQGGELKEQRILEWSVDPSAAYVPCGDWNPLVTSLESTSSRYYVPDPSPSELLELMAVEERLLDTEGPIFLFLICSSSCPLNKEISVQPFVVTQLAKGGVIDAQAWYNRLQRKCFGAIVLDHSLEEAEQAPTGVGWHLTPRSVMLMKDQCDVAAVQSHWEVLIYLPKTEQ